MKNIFFLLVYLIGISGGYYGANEIIAKYKATADKDNAPKIVPLKKKPKNKRIHYKQVT